MKEERSVTRMKNAKNMKCVEDSRRIWRQTSEIRCIKRVRTITKNCVSKWSSQGCVKWMWIIDIIMRFEYGISYGTIIDLYICPTNVYMHQYIWYSEINNDMMMLTRRSYECNELRFGIVDKILVLLLTCIFVQPTYTCTSIYDMVKSISIRMSERWINNLC